MCNAVVRLCFIRLIVLCQSWFATRAVTQMNYRKKLQWPRAVRRSGGQTGLARQVLVDTNEHKQAATKLVCTRKQLRGKTVSLRARGLKTPPTRAQRKLEQVWGLRPPCPSKTRRGPQGVSRSDASPFRTTLLARPRERKLPRSPGKSTTRDLV